MKWFSFFRKTVNIYVNTSIHDRTRRIDNIIDRVRSANEKDCPDIIPDAIILGKMLFGRPIRLLAITGHS